MRMQTRLLFFISLFILFVVGQIYAGEHTFVGANGCKICHKGDSKGNQFEIWESSKHAKAIDGLKTEEAIKIGKEKGLATAPSESPQCLKCHLTGHDADPSMLDAKFDKSLGVQCESCHGAGGDYKGMATMKDRNKAIEAGLNPILVADGSAEKHCRTCHNEESPVFKGFNFEEYWAKIKHPRPAK